MNSSETLTWRWASLVAQMVKNLPTMQETQVQSRVREDPLEREWQPTPVFLSKNCMDRGAWPGTIHGSQTVRHD